MSSYVMLCNFLPDNFHVILYKSELVLDCVHYFFFYKNVDMSNFGTENDG